MDYQALFNCILSEKTLSIHCFSCPLPTGSEPAVDLCPPCACLRCFCLHPPYSPVRNPHLSLISQRINFLIRTSANQTLHRDFQRGWPKLHSSWPHNTSVLSMALAPPKWERITAALVSSGNHPYLTCCFKCLFRKPRNWEEKTKRWLSSHSFAGRMSTSYFIQCTCWWGSEISLPNSSMMLLIL